MTLPPMSQLTAIAEYVGEMLGLKVDAVDTCNLSACRLHFKAPIPTPGDEYCLLFVVPVYYRPDRVDSGLPAEWRIRGTVSTSIPAQTLAAISQYMTMWYESDGNP